MAYLNDDDKKHLDAESVEETDAESALGHEVASGADNVSDVDAIDESLGIYEDNSDSPDAGPENPAEVDIAREIAMHDEG